MMASRYPPQIFWVLAAALAYTLLAVAEGETGNAALFILSLTRRENAARRGFKEGRHITHDALHRVGSCRHALEDLQHGLVPQNAPL